MTLAEIHADIDHRVDLIRTEYPDWPCRSGCAGCCHRLAEIPLLTVSEWALLREGLSLLPATILLSIRQNIAALYDQQSRPMVCPLLNQQAGTCRVYPYRPTLCRSYGYYVQRDKGLFCHDIEAQVAGGKLDNVVWGNQEVLDQRLKNTGAMRELIAWFADWRMVDVK